MYTRAFAAAFFYTLLICLGIALMKWLISQVSVTFFAVILIVASMLSVLAHGREDEEHEKY